MACEKAGVKWTGGFFRPLLSVNNPSYAGEKTNPNFSAEKFYNFIPVAFLLP
jgi:hypothetical protein